MNIVKYFLSLFKSKTPNPTTVAAIKAAEKGEVTKVATVPELMADLNDVPAAPKKKRVRKAVTKVEPADLVIEALASPKPRSRKKADKK
jgi:hypothetical protein